MINYNIASKRPYNSASGTFQDPTCPGEKITPYIPWTYPGGIPKGAINGCKVMPHTIALKILEDGSVVTQEGRAVAKLNPGVTVNFTPLSYDSIINGTTSSNTTTVAAATGAQPIAGGTTTATPAAAGGGGQFMQLAPSTNIPVPAPFNNVAPPRSKDLNKMDTGGEVVRVQGIEQKVGEAELTDNMNSQDEFRVHITYKDGNCFFNSVEQAISSLPGKKVTIEQLRAAVASKVLTPGPIDDTIMMWHTFYNEAKKADDRGMMEEYGMVATVANDILPLNQDGRERLYKAMMSKDYWAEEFAVHAVEQALQIKCLILDGNNKKALAGFDHGMHWRPKYYIILVLKNLHYQPVSSKGKFCFMKNEIPPDVVAKFNHDCADSPYAYINLREEVHQPNEIPPLPVL